MIQNEFEFLPIRPAATCWPSVAALYESAFPAEERRPTAAWTQLVEQSRQFRVMAYAAADRLTGFISYWDFNDFVYVEHFAVSTQERNRGWGAQIFKLLQKEIGWRPVVLEVETPDTPMAARRIGFYERLGLVLSNVPYMQPPYRKGDDWFPLLLMSTDNAFLSANATRVKREIHTKVYGVMAEMA